MIKYVYKFKTERPIEEVFELISDVANYNQWVPSSSMVFIDTTITSVNQKGIGLTFVDKLILGGRTFGEIVEYIPPTLFSIEQRTSYVLPFSMTNISYQLSGDTNVTQITHITTAKAFGIFKLFTPILKIFITKERTATCDQIVHKLEKDI